MEKKSVANNKKILNFRDLVERYKTFGDNIAFKYKKDKMIKEITYNQYVDDIINVFGLNSEDPDNIIIYTAWCKSKEVEDLIFVTNDICCKNIARNIFGLKVESANKKEEIYTI